MERKCGQHNSAGERWTGRIAATPDGVSPASVTLAVIGRGWYRRLAPLLGVVGPAELAGIILITDPEDPDVSHARTCGIRVVTDRKHSRLTLELEGSLAMDEGAPEATQSDETPSPFVFSGSARYAIRATLLEQGITRREVEVAEFAITGLSDREIASKLFISEATVGRHLGSVFAKLGVARRCGLMAFAYRTVTSSL